MGLHTWVMPLGNFNPSHPTVLAFPAVFAGQRPVPMPQSPWVLTRWTSCLGPCFRSASMCSSGLRCCSSYTLDFVLSVFPLRCVIITSLRMTKTFFEWLPEVSPACLPVISISANCTTICSFLCWLKPLESSHAFLSLQSSVHQHCRLVLLQNNM